MVTLILTITFFGESIRALLSGPLARTWVTILLAVTVQALPFLVLGVVVSSALAAFVAAPALARMVPRRTALSIPIASVAGAALPGCECSSVVVAGRLVRSGVPPGAAVAFLIAAPAINPVVMVATAVAFPGEPRLVIARFLASLTTAMLVGLVWGRLGHVPSVSEAAGAWRTDRTWPLFAETFVQDFTVAGGFLVLGAAATATLQVTAGPAALGALGSHGFLAVPVMAVMAVVLCVCSEADAFVAATFTQFSSTARLVFMVVGPAVDLKLVALQAGTFGARFAARFAPLAFVLAVVASLVVGAVLL